MIECQIQASHEDPSVGSHYFAEDDMLYYKRSTRELAFPGGFNRNLNKT